jgi:hypothetical protein
MAKPVAQQSSSVYVPSAAPLGEPTYEDLECCLVSLRGALCRQRPTRFTAYAIATIDRCLPADLRPMKDPNEPQT